PAAAPLKRQPTSDHPGEKGSGFIKDVCVGEYCENIF
ncbi:MAG: hypothetical protein ACI92C_001464, partial [Neolewinella sp.]